MKVTLISPYTDITAFGIRTLSAFLKQHGHTVQLIFMPDPYGDDLVYGVKRYPDSVMGEVIPLCAESGLIGISVMTNFFDGAVQITGAVKDKLEVPVIWGGVHPTIRPEECLGHADLVCVGEGEDVLLELADKMGGGDAYGDTRNLWGKRGDTVFRNPLRPLVSDLDKYPAPDYSMEDHHVMVDGGIQPLSHDLLERFLNRGTVSQYLGKSGYQTMTSRGCPNRCSYCINYTLNQLYGGKGKPRWRSVSHVMRELSWVKEHMPYVNYVWISDDEFMARRVGDLKDFCSAYMEQIGLPFSCLASPLSVTEERMSMLVDAGLIYVQMGVESGSERMQGLYHRKHMNNKRMMKAIKTIHRFKDKMYPPSYDFLIDAPFESDQDKIDSLRFIAEIPKPFRLQPFTLILYPGTGMYEMAKEKGYIEDEGREIYNKTYTMRKRTYLNLLMTLCRTGRFPSKLLKILVNPPFVGLLNSDALRPAFKWMYLLMESFHHRLKGLRVRA